MKYRFCGMELIIHKKPIRYDPIAQYKDQIDERLDKIKALVIKNKSS